VTNRRPLIRCTGAALVLSLASCRTITVEPEGPGLPALPAAKRPALDFELHVTVDPHLSCRDTLESQSVVVDGEDLADLIAPFREALEATNVFSTIRRAPAGRRLHCNLSVRMFHPDPMAFLLVCTAGLSPEVTNCHYEIVASVSAPGRLPQTYTVRSHGQTLLWTPLIPIGLVQLLVQSGTLQQTMDSLVARMAAYGWLQG
jgi:hypothetical protein